MDKHTGQNVLAIRLSRESGQALHNYSRKHIGREMEMRINGQTVGTATIRDPLVGSIWWAGLDADKARELADQLSEAGVSVELDIVP